MFILIKLRENSLYYCLQLVGIGQVDIINAKPSTLVKESNRLN